eukprot:PhF_6_TR37449/c0_g1_i4/m.55062
MQCGRPRTPRPIENYHPRKRILQRVRRRIGFACVIIVRGFEKRSRLAILTQMRFHFQLILKQLKHARLEEKRKLYCKALIRDSLVQVQVQLEAIRTIHGAFSAYVTRHCCFKVWLNRKQNDHRIDKFIRGYQCRVALGVVFHESQRQRQEIINARRTYKSLTVLRGACSLVPTESFPALGNLMYLGLLDRLPMTDLPLTSPLTSPLADIQPDRCKRVPKFEDVIRGEDESLNMTMSMRLHVVEPSVQSHPALTALRGACGLHGNEPLYALDSLFYL